ncbi:putative 50S ribosomal subunit protein L17 [Candidatus Hodgkinia cicadicola Dsem]|nr:putative 50S ribosomal subunit protein L17 [Candidatus Hodgkinia cicadicola Dsem]
MLKLSGRSHLVLSLVKAFVAHTRVVSVTQRLKQAKPKLEKLVTLASRAQKLGLARVIRLLRAKMACGQATAKALVLMAPRLARRRGGYLKLLKLGRRRGDAAHMSAMVCA